MKKTFSFLMIALVATLLTNSLACAATGTQTIEVPPVFIPGTSLFIISDLSVLHPAFMAAAKDPKGKVYSTLFSALVPPIGSAPEEMEKWRVELIREEADSACTDFGHLFATMNTETGNACLLTQAKTDPRNTAKRIRDKASATVKLDQPDHFILSVEQRPVDPESTNAVHGPVDVDITKERILVTNGVPTPTPPEWQDAVQAAGEPNTVFFLELVGSLSYNLPVVQTATADPALDECLLNMEELSQVMDQIPPYDRFWWPKHLKFDDQGNCPEINSQLLIPTKELVDRAYMSAELICRAGGKYYIQTNADSKDCGGCTKHGRHTERVKSRDNPDPQPASFSAIRLAVGTTWAKVLVRVNDVQEREVFKQRLSAYLEEQKIIREHNSIYPLDGFRDEMERDYPLIKQIQTIESGHWLGLSLTVGDPLELARFSLRLVGAAWFDLTFSVARQSFGGK